MAQEYVKVKVKVELPSVNRKAGTAVSTLMYRFHKPGLNLGGLTDFPD